VRRPPGAQSASLRASVSKEVMTLEAAVVACGTPRRSVLFSVPASPCRQAARKKKCGPRSPFTNRSAILRHSPELLLLFSPSFFSSPVRPSGAMCRRAVALGPAPSASIQVPPPQRVELHLRAGPPGREPSVVSARIRGLCLPLALPPAADGRALYLVHARALVRSKLSASSHSA